MSSYNRDESSLLLLPERGVGRGRQGVILVVGCTILRWQSLSLEASGEKWVKPHDAKTKGGRNHVPVITVNITELLPVFAGRLLRFLLFKQIFLLSHFH